MAISDQNAATLNTALGPVSTVKTTDGTYLAVGTMIQTLQTLTESQQTELDTLGAEPVIGLGYAGTRTVAQINLLSPSAGDCYVVSNAGTLTTGTLAVTAGDLVAYSGSAWVLLADAVDGFVPALSVIVGTGTLYAPLTDGTDEKKVATFTGRSNTPALVTPSAGDIKRVIAGPDGSAVTVNRIYMYSGSAWVTATSATLSSATPQPLGVAAAGSTGSASDAGHIHALPTTLPVDYQVYNDAGVDRVTNTATETAFSTAYTLPANALAEGSVWTGEARVYVAGVTGTPNLIIRLNIGGIAVSAVQVTSVTADAAYDLKFEVIVGVDGASGVAVMNVNGISYTLSNVGTQKPNAYIGAFDTTATKALTVSAEWNAASASNQADLRLLRSSYRAASA